MDEKELEPSGFQLLVVRRAQQPSVITEEDLREEAAELIWDEFKKHLHTESAIINGELIVTVSCPVPMVVYNAFKGR